MDLRPDRLPCQSRQTGRTDDSKLRATQAMPAFLICELINIRRDLLVPHTLTHSLGVPSRSVIHVHVTHCYEAIEDVTFSSVESRKHAVKDELRQHGAYVCIATGRGREEFEGAVSHTFPSCCDERKPSLPFHDLSVAQPCSRFVRANRTLAHPLPCLRRKRAPPSTCMRALAPPVR